MKYLKKLLEKLKHNFLLKLLSLAVAFVLWIVVVNTEDPTTTVTFRDVPVEMLNESSIRDNGKIPEVLSGDTVTVTIQARKSICDKLSADDIIAVADYDKISITETIPVEVSVNGYDDDDVEVIRGQNQYVKLSLEDEDSKDFKVKVVTSGDAAEGYYVASAIASPNVVTVTGSKTQISKIEDVIVTVNVSNRSSEFVETVTAVAVDGNGDTVSSDKATIDTTGISVDIVFYATKEIKVQANLNGEPGEDYEVMGISIQPSTVTVAGLADDLDKLPDAITADIDITGATTAVEANLDILDFIDDSLTSIKAVDDDTVAVKVSIEKQQTSQRLLLTSDIALKNLDTKLSAQISSLNQRIILIQGKTDVLQDMTSELLGAYIDLSGYTEPGEYDNLPVVFETSEGIKVFTEVYATVKITEAAE